MTTARELANLLTILSHSNEPVANKLYQLLRTRSWSSEELKMIHATIKANPEYYGLSRHKDGSFTRKVNLFAKKEKSDG